MKKVQLFIFALTLSTSMAQASNNYEKIKTGFLLADAIVSPSLIDQTRSGICLGPNDKWPVYLSGTYIDSNASSNNSIHTLNSNRVYFGGILYRLADTDLEAYWEQVRFSAKNWPSHTNPGEENVVETANDRKSLKFWSYVSNFLTQGKNTFYTVKLDNKGEIYASIIDGGNSAIGEDPKMPSPTQEPYYCTFY